MSALEYNRKDPTDLAGYADGELDESASRLMEERLLNEANLRKELATQKHYGPGNTALWNETAAPLPTSQQWEIAKAEIGQRVKAGTGGTRFWGICVGSAVAAVVMLGITLKPNPPAPQMALEPVITTPSEEVAILPAAATTDVEIHGMRAGAWQAMLVGVSPLPIKFEWAALKDINLLASSMPEDFFGPEPKLVGNNNDGPVIWADDSR